MSAAAGTLRLTLVRHAKSSWRFTTLDDFHRPLNARGLADAARMPARLTARMPAPQLMLCSDAVRAVQTGEALAAAFDLPGACVQLHHALYMASAAGILECLAGAAGAARHVMLVGHNPGLTDLYNHLIAMPVDNLPTLAVAPLVLEAPAWSAVAPGCGRIERLLRPKEMFKDG
jgi:phosphohistidine phosphatase